MVRVYLLWASISHGTAHKQSSMRERIAELGLGGCDDESRWSVPTDWRWRLENACTFSLEVGGDTQRSGQCSAFGTFAFLSKGSVQRKVSNEEGI